MKKLTMLLAILIMLTAVGCAARDKAPAITTESAESTESVTASAPETTAGEGTVSDTSVPTETEAVTEDGVGDEGLSTFTETFVNGECSVSLTYPKYGDGEHDLFDVAMRSYAVQKYNQSGMMPEDSAVYEITACDVKYETEQFVSAVMTGHIINPTAAHDTNFAYTVNADPRNGRIYLSEELIGDVELLKSAMHAGRFTKTYGIDGLEVALSNGVVTYEVITQSWRSDYGVFPDMYFTHDSFGVMAELPHVVGGYAGFELPYAEAGDMLNPAARGLVTATD